MKFDVCLVIEATVICLFALCLVVCPLSDGQPGRDIRSTGNVHKDKPDPVPKTSDNKVPVAGAIPPTHNDTNVTPAALLVSSTPRPYTKGSVEANCTTGNGTECRVDNSFGALLHKNKGMLQRAVYVLIAVTVVILIYFGIRTWSTRKRRSKAKKYGLITTPVSDLEMTPLDQEDEDEDMTVFEVNGLK